MEKRIDWARPGDIGEVMRIEDAAFARGIREDRDVFLARLKLFPTGNTVLLTGPEMAEKPGTVRPLGGYFCSELWDAVPPLTEESYALGHPMEERHDPSGSVLYISSFAADPAVRGVGRLLFTGSLKMILKANPQIARMVLAVNETWLAARHIYETEGFSYTGKLEQFFDNHDNGDSGVRSDALIMEKSIQ
ncbi:hypothetical protein [Breznakiella homolactica]|uniref:N-acetyltransferase domain-containing protein n=1 Tax=Breznakiella homolactica TaxID=2798577 RepID=A0A7T7XN09_9SPIR|nr:hypothetical protein [Breznakiella homolactica]QQO09293.1 hypothetical protein JFL75_20580 [Breznakiella homolactica]